MYRMVTGAALTSVLILTSGFFVPARARDLPAKMSGCSAREMGILNHYRAAKDDSEREASKSEFESGVSDTCKSQYTLWIMNRPLWNYETDGPCISASDQYGLAYYIETQQLINTGRLSINEVLARTVQATQRLSAQCLTAVAKAVGKPNEPPSPSAPACATRPLAPGEVCRMPGVGTARSPLP
jgi:hypothetical protein